MWFSVFPTVKFLQNSSCNPGSMLFSAGEEASRLRGMVRRRRRLIKLMGNTTIIRSSHFEPISPPTAKILTFHPSPRWFFT